MKYAEGTTVPVEKSRAEIERLITSNGGKNFAFLAGETSHVIVFEFNDRRLKFSVTKPAKNSFPVYIRGRRQTDKQLTEKQDAEFRRLFRVLLLRLKAKFEGVKSKEISFDEEFLANIVTPDGSTVYETIKPHLTELQPGQLPKLLTGGFQ